MEERRYRRVESGERIDDRGGGAGRENRGEGETRGNRGKAGKGNREYKIQKRG